MSDLQYQVPTTRTYEPELPLALLALDPKNCRSGHVYDHEDLHQLSESIREAGGLIQPIIARPRPAWVPADHDPDCPLMIVCGHRRYAASILAGLDTARVHIWPDLTDRQATEIQLMENLHRKDITPLDEARALRRMIDELDYSTMECAQAIGRTDQHVRNRLRLMELPEDAQELIESGEIKLAVANVLIQLPEPVQARVLADCKTGDVQELRRHVQFVCMRDLTHTAFSLDGDYAGLTPCTQCKHRGASIDLLGDGESRECPDAACFDKKTKAYWKLRNAEHKSRQVVDQAAVKVDQEAQQRTRIINNAKSQAEDLVYMEAILRKAIDSADDVPRILMCATDPSEIVIDKQRCELLCSLLGYDFNPATGWTNWSDISEYIPDDLSPALSLVALIGFTFDTSSLKASCAILSIKVDQAILKSAVKAAAKVATAELDKAAKEAEASQPKRRGKPMKAGRNA